MGEKREKLVNQWIKNILTYKIAEKRSKIWSIK